MYNTIFGKKFGQLLLSGLEFNIIYIFMPES